MAACWRLGARLQLKLANGSGTSLGLPGQRFELCLLSQLACSSGELPASSATDTENRTECAAGD